MENQMPYQTQPVAGGDLSHLTDMFSTYRQSVKKPDTKKSKEEILAKYFTPRKTSENFRILPVKPGRLFYEEAYFHVVPTIGSGGKINYSTVVYCICKNEPKVPKLDAQGNVMLQENGQQILVPQTCPLCEKSKQILEKQDNSIAYKKREELDENGKMIFDKNREIFKEASKWEAKKFYIIRGIDRGREGDGVKFWRFKHNFKQQGVMDKLTPVLEAYVTHQQANFMSPVDGTDLNIVMAESEFMGKKYMAVSAVIAKGKTPLHYDGFVANQWLQDTTTWRDVFKAKKTNLVSEYEYLQMVANLANPYYDEIEKRWVYPGRPDLEAKANTRDVNLMDKQVTESFASDIDQGQQVTITNITSQNVGQYRDNAVDIGAPSQYTQQPVYKQQVQQQPVYQQQVQQPVYQQQAPQQVQQQQVQQQPVTQQPIVQQPVYQQPVVQQAPQQVQQQPVYQQQVHQPVQQQPVYQQLVQNVVTPPTYDASQIPTEDEIDDLPF